MIKSPKIYLRDTGLLHHLLNINSLEDLDSHPIRGASWETFVLEDLIRRERLKHPHTQVFFWRTAKGDEVDLVLEPGTRLIPVEVKIGHGGKPRDARKLQNAARDLGARTASIIDQAGGAEGVVQHIERRGMAESLDWLPES